MPIKSVKMKISKNKKMRFFLMSQGSLNPKIRFLGQNVWSAAPSQTDRQTDTQSDYWGHPFRVSGLCPSTYHQGSAQYLENTYLRYIFITKMFWCFFWYWMALYLLGRERAVQLGVMLVSSWKVSLKESSVEINCTTSSKYAYHMYM